MNGSVNRREFLKSIGVGAASLAFGAGLRGGSNRGGSRPVNLLFIMTDQQRFDALSRAGNRILKTPNLDRLAAEGVFFENAYTGCPVCVPARTVILTGHGIESVRVKSNGDYDRPDVADVPTFDNILSRRGYRTEYYGKWHSPYKFASTYDNAVRQTGKHSRDGTAPSMKAAYIEYLNKHVPARPPRAGELTDRSSGRPYRPDPLDRRYGAESEEPGADHKGSRKAARAKAKKSKLSSQAGSYGCLDIPAEHTRTAFTAKETIAALERMKGGPFSLTCSFGPPHPPMVLPRPYYGMYAAEDIPAPGSIDDPMSDSPYAAKAGGEDMKRYRNKGHIRQMTSNYYGLVKEVDDWVGRILDKLRDLGLERDTLVVFTSDHGEMLGDHGLHGKAVFYEGSAHIPLLMRLGGSIAGGTVVSTPVSHADVFATILDYLDVPAHESDGRSLRPLIEGKGDGGMDFCVSEWGAESGATLMVRTKRWKYICSHSRRSKSVDALYDLEEDPLEMNNLIGKRPKAARHVEQAAAMKARLVSWLERVGSPRLEGVKDRPV
ncbi:MAG: sulfatase-like hydrolase/transferase [Phycisphaerales bacterium]|nr:MAG: sulfatase-like hydrolase/transferase [Phycisphaerales bacterium]